MQICFQQKSLSISSLFLFQSQAAISTFICTENNCYLLPCNNYIHLHLHTASNSLNLFIQLINFLNLLNSMASIGIHTNGSQFYLALNPMPQLNGRCVAFARVVKGNDSIDAIEKVNHTSFLYSIAVNHCTVLDFAVHYFCCYRCSVICLCFTSRF